jgi:hypothetical protein
MCLAGSIRESFQFGATGRGRKRRIQYGDCALARSALGSFASDAFRASVTPCREWFESGRYRVKVER